MIDSASIISAPSDRLERALAAFLRPELTSPIAGITQLLDILVIDARDLKLDEVGLDLVRMRTASIDLAALVNQVIDSPNAIPKEQEAIEDFRRRLRHDLRTPLNTIKGFAAMLLDDFKGSRHERLVAKLRTVL